MSRPGYPKIEFEIRDVNNSYFRALDGATFEGTSPVSYRLLAEDAIGGNTVGWPTVKQDNAYQRFRYTRNDRPATVNGSNSINGDRVSGSWAAQGFDKNWDPYHINSPGLTEAINALKSQIKYRLIDKIKDSRVNLAQAIAERDQVARMVGSTARRLAGTLRNLRTGNISGAMTQLLGPSGRPRDGGRSFRNRYGGIPEQWLALQYGWKPLLGDIDGACKELAALLQQEPPVFSARTRVPKRDVGPFSTVQRPNQYPLWPGRRWVRDKAELQGWGYVEYAVSSSFGQTVSRTGILDPWLLAWELLPWSFVVDWALPVGRWLESLQFDAGLIFKRGWISWQFEDQWTATLESSSTQDQGWSLNWLGGDSTAECFFFQRDLMEGALTPDLPSFRNPLSLRNMANGLSLLAVTFGGPSGAGPRFR